MGKEDILKYNIREKKLLKSVLTATTVIVLCVVLIAPQVIAITLLQTRSIEIKGAKYDRFEDDWYYLPAFPNYAPNGLPDFDQKQANWKAWGFWTYCGPTALADVLWWFDAKHSDPSGSPGDGKDTFPLVSNYNAPGTPEPGPHSDDHNFNNINDLQTSLDGKIQNGELIEQLAWYVNNDRCRIPILTIPGTSRLDMKWGTKKWIRDAGLQNNFKVESIVKPSFSTINERLRNNEGIILQLGFYIPGFELFPIIFQHYVAVAGINSNGYIALSDPDWDLVNPNSDSTLHNDASIVSHDVYQVNFTSPCPLISSWWIPNYAVHRRVVVIGAIIISETD